jgi:hypothetical protein
MKPKEIGSRVTANRRVPGRLAPLPMEWMDPMSWRLPSGKALAEFALQAGFLAPLILSGPNLKPKKRSTSPEVAGPVLNKHVGEVPDSPGSFRETGSL